VIPITCVCVVCSFVSQIIAQVLPRLDGSKRSVREIKSSLVASLGEARAEVVWSVLLDNGALQDDALSQFQTDFDEPGATKAKRERVGEISAYAKAAADRVQESEARQEGGATGVGEDLATVIDRETMRALRRRPTRRAAVYDLFLNFFVDRGLSSLIKSSVGLFSILNVR
jgi:hypothetical protein